MLQVAFQSISARNKLDGERTVDPVRPDADAVSYWYNGEVMHVSAEYDRLESGESRRDALLHWMREKPSHKQQLRRGVGSIACRDNRQIHFETAYYRGHYPEDPRGGMLTAARTMFEEAIGGHHLTDILTRRVPIEEMHYGRLGPLTDQLISSLADSIHKN